MAGANSELGGWFGAPNECDGGSKCIVHHATVGCAEELRIAATRQGVVELADNRMVEMSMADVWATTDGRSTTTIVLLGDEGTSPLLGAYTLEGLLSAVDPVNERLVSTHGILY